MGTASSVPKEQPEKIVYQNLDNGATFTGNEDNTELLFDGGITPWRSNCIFLEKPVHLSSGFAVTLKITGSGVIRFGLSSQDPQSFKTFINSTLVSHEDGFENGKNVRMLLVDAFSCITYVDKATGRKKILTEVDQQGREAWLYMIVLHGRPGICVQKDRCFCKLKTFEPSNITIQGDEAIPGHTSNSGVCRLKRPLLWDQIYHVNWEMKLNETGGDNHSRSRKYGFFRLGVVSDVPESFNQMSIYSDSVPRQGVWFVESAISSFIYNDTIIFSANKRNGEVTHNVTLSSATETKTEDFPFDCTKQLYLVLEIFHGDIRSVRAYPANKEPKQVYPGHILLFRNFKADDALPEHIQIGSILKTEPCRIQYGTAPTLVLAEFRTIINPASIKQRPGNRPLPWSSVQDIKESDKIQVLQVPDDTEKHDLITYFSNKSACGGGQISAINKNEDIPGCWIIRYKNRSDARAVWQERQHRLNKSLVSALPYYDELGPSANNGLKPKFDTSDLHILIDDEKKLNYLMKFEKKRFEEYMMKMNFHIIWPDSTKPEFEDDNESHEDNHIVVQCTARADQYQKLVSWKDSAKKAVKSYLSDIRTWNYTVDKKVWDDAVGLLKKEQQRKSFFFEGRKSKGSIEIITANQAVLTELKTKIQTIPLPEDQVIEEFGVDVLKYRALDEAGYLTKLDKENSMTSSTLNTKTCRLILKGPKSEVTRMKTGLLRLLANIEKVSVSQSEGKLKFLKGMKGKLILEQELKKRKLTQKFEISNSCCEICVYLESAEKFKQIEKDFKSCISNIIKEETIDIPDNLIESLFKFEDIAAALRDIGRQNDDEVIVSIVETEITCTGTASAVKNAKRTILDLLKGNKNDKSVEYFQRNIVNYMDAYKENFDCNNCSFHRDRDGVLTGEVTVEGKPEEIKQRKDALVKETERISTFWFYLERPWLANVITNLDTLHTLAEDLRCLLTPEIGDTLAQANVSLIAISNSGTAVQTISCDITAQDTDVIVNFANAELEMKGGLAKAISDAAGRSVQDECRKYIKDNGKVGEGEAIFTCSGKLHCREIIHVVGPVWKDGYSNEKHTLKMGILKVLDMASRRKYLSVMIPALRDAAFGFPVDSATEQIVEAICSFESNNPKSTVKDIYLCDNKQTSITHFENALKKVLQKKWFIFEHKRQLQSNSEKTDEPGDKKSMSVSPFLKTRRPGQRTTIMGQSFRWGRNRLQPSPTPTQSSTSSESSDEEPKIPRKRHTPLPDIKEESDTENVPIPIPMSLPMSMDITGKTKLRIIRGTIETQQHDVIVCTTPQFPNLVGAVANALVQKGGESIKSECKRKGELKFGDVICTGKGNLACKVLFHVLTLMDWNERAGSKNLQNIVKPCLRMADAQGYKSLAFPAIGTGASHYPADKVAEIMILTVLGYVKNNPKTRLEELLIVIYERDTATAQTFENVVPKLLNPSARTNDSSKREEMKKRTDDETNVAEIARVKDLRVQYVEPETAEDHSKADDVVLIQVTAAGTSLATIKQEAEKLIDREFLRKEIDFKSLTDENRLNDEEVKRLKELNTTKVKLDIDQKAVSVIISGLRMDVMKTENEACNLLRTVFPERRKQKQIELRISEFVQWQVCDNQQNYTNIPPDVNFELETNFESGNDFRYFNNGVEYQVLVPSLEEHPVNNPQMKRKLKRIFKARDTSITVPREWTISSTSDDYKEVDVPANDPLFSKIKKQFTDAGCRPNSVDRIIRIENRTLFLQYEVMKKKIEIKNPRNKQNVRELWHGTDSFTITLICQKGFNRSFAGKNATMYGEGVYFAYASGYSDRFAHPDMNGTKRMILTEVLTGEYCQGRQGMKSPPQKKGHILYDSLVDNMQNPGIFVIFHDTQAYPKYVIEYS